MNTARLVKELDGFMGYACLYELNPPLNDWYEDNKYNFVVVSAVNAWFSGPETYIFPATPEGEIIDWGELPGSYQGGMSHQRALSRAGEYSIIE